MMIEEHDRYPKIRKYLSSKMRPRFTKISNIPLYSNLLFSYYCTLVRYRSRFPFTVNPKNEKYHAIDTAVQRRSRTPFDPTYPIFLESMPTAPRQIQIRMKRAHDIARLITSLIRSRERSKSDRRLGYDFQQLLRGKKK